MKKVIRKPPSKQTRKEKLINLEAARAAKRKGKKKVKPKITPKKRKAKPRTRTKTRTMSKRRRTSTNILTGGTGDVNPQYYNGVVAQVVEDTVVENSFPLPVTRIPQGNRATIVEILKIFWMPAVWQTPSVAPVLDQFQEISFSTIAQGNVAFAGFEEPNVFCQMQVRCNNILAAGGTFYSHGPHLPLVFNMTDDAGHGVLIASDRVFVQIASFNLGVKRSFPFKILYRFKTVNITEYVGIVQSQQ